MKKRNLLGLILLLLFSFTLMACEENGDGKVDLSKVDISITSFATGDTVNSVTKDFVLPVEFDKGVTATWESDNEAVLEIDGANATVIRPAKNDEEVNLTATLNHVDAEGEEATLKRAPIVVTVKKFDLAAVVIPEFTLSEGDTVNAITDNFILPLEFDGVSATWVSSDPEVINIEGANAIVVRPKEADKEVSLVPTVKYVASSEDEMELELTAIVVTVKLLNLSPVVEGVVYHWMPDSVGVEVTAAIELNGVDELDVVVKLGEDELVEGLDFEIYDGELIIYGDFLVEFSNELGEYELEITTEHGTTLFTYYVVDNPENTSIETEEIEISDMSALTQAEITEPIAGAPALMITEVGADAGKYSYIEVFNNSDEPRNLKNHIIVFGNLTLDAIKNSLLNYDGLISAPMGAVPFVISEDFVLEPFETGIIWYINGGNNVPWSHLKDNTGAAADYNSIAEVDAAKPWLFDWQGGTLTEVDFRRTHGISEEAKIVVVRNNQYTTNQTTALSEDGFGTPVYRGGGFGGQNSSVANRAVQIIYFDPEVKYPADESEKAPLGADYFKIEVGVLNKDKDVYENGSLDLSKIKVLAGRYTINLFFIRTLYYNSDDEFLGYVQEWNHATDAATGNNGWNHETYMIRAQDAILSTALFYPGLDEDGQYRWGIGHGMEYTIPVEGSHIMRFIPRTTEFDYEEFIDVVYTNQLLNTLYKMGLSPTIEEITESTKTVIVPVNKAYKYEAPASQNTAGITSKYNLGILD